MRGHGNMLSSAGVAIVVVVVWQAVVAGATCAFRFTGYPNTSELPIIGLPMAEPYGPETSVFSTRDVIVYLASDGITESAVNCTSDSWRYQTAEGDWRTTVAFPDGVGMETASFDDLFNATADGYITLSRIPASIAPALSDSLYGRTIQLNLTCNQDDPIDEADSCVIFRVDFANYSPWDDVSMALYRFKEPAVPRFELPEAQPNSSGDVQLNEGNPIVELDGSIVDNGCNGDRAEYMGENGEWYFHFTGSDGQMYNLSHVFYATEQDHVNIATIQEVWSPNLEAALKNRVVRLLIHCNNEVDFEEGFLMFYVGDVGLGESCASHPGLCVAGDDTAGGVDGSAAAGRYGSPAIVSASMLVVVAMGAALTSVGDWLAV